MKRIVITAGVLLFLAVLLTSPLAYANGGEESRAVMKEELTILYSANTRGTVKPYG